MKTKIIFLLCISMYAFHCRAQYTPSAPITLSSKSNMIISGKSFTSGTNGISIFLSGCSNIRITNCNFLLNSGIIGIQLQNCSNIEIDGNHMENFRSGVYATNCTGGINIHCNSFKDIAGERPRGQIVQFNGCKGAGNRVNYNTLDHTLGIGIPEDLINMYASSGIASDPLQIIGNNLRGGGPSTTGGGIMVGDNDGHDIIVADNILVDPGQYGIGVPAGYNITVKNNKIFAKQQAWTNVGLYVGLAGEIAAGFPCSGNTIRVEGNQVNWTSKTGGKNGWYNCSCCPGVIQVNNNFNAPITASILPVTLTINNTACGTTPAPVVNKAPSVSLTSPVAPASFTAPASIALSATASDVDGSISKVEFYNGTTLLGTDVTSPYSFSWGNVAAGIYSLTAKATDNLGSITSSSTAVITINTAIPSANVVPTVSLTAPINNSSYTAPATVSLSATASDMDGTISKVEFYNGTTLIASDASAPYTYVWSAVVAGSYNIKAKAYDNSGASTIGSSIVITVAAAPVPPITVSGLNGLSCLTAGQTYTYTVVPEFTYTTIQFWSNTGAVITQDAVDKKKMTIQIPSYMNGSSFILYSGVNYSVSPWYKEYTKTIKVGGCSARINATLSPQPTESNSMLELENNVKILSVVVYDGQGKEVYRTENISSEKFELGSNLVEGLYNVIIQSEEGMTSTRFLKK
jgi:hypothetical protein